MVGDVAGGDCGEGDAGGGDVGDTGCAWTGGGGVVRASDEERATGVAA